jgi:hypothetical protein
MMARPEIIKVWGRADDIELNFVKDESGAGWYISVPADMVDGTYACEFTALNASGNYGFWTGFLYMCNGICHFKFRQVDYRLFFDDIKPTADIVFDDVENYKISICPNEKYKIVFSDIPEMIIFDRRCRHYDE